MSDLLGSREQLERALLSDPFDQSLRESYARLLSDLSDHEAALAQWQLLTRGSAAGAKIHVELALCLDRLGRDDERARAIELARGCADFEAVSSVLDETRRKLLESDQAPQRLRVVAGGANRKAELGEVVSISRSGTVRFSDVAGMEELKKVLRLRIIEPFARPGLFERFKRRAGGGVLLYGPPGCGKTMMAKAIATECKATFTAVGISDVLNMWVGQSEQNLASLFAKTRQERPSVLFFDELDALAYSRSKANSDHTRTTVNEFLNQLDGMSGQNDGVLVLGATNMPWDVDEAMKRPGRFDRQVFVPPPDAEARSAMFRLKLRDIPTRDLDFEELGRRSEHFSGADIDGAIEAAKDVVLLQAIERDAERALQQADLLEAIEQTAPSTVEWMKTARNLVKFGNVGKAYADVEKYLRAARLY